MSAAQAEKARADLSASVANLRALGYQTDEGAILKMLGAKLAPPPDPRVAHEARRREIDDILREDARRFPAFADARWAAVLAACEDHERVGRSEFWTTRMTERLLVDLHRYEEARGAGREPSAEVIALDYLDRVESDAYERARGGAVAPLLGRRYRSEPSHYAGVARATAAR